MVPLKRRDRERKTKTGHQDLQAAACPGVRVAVYIFAEEAKVAIGLRLSDVHEHSKPIRNRSPLENGGSKK